MYGSVVLPQRREVREKKERDCFESAENGSRLQVQEEKGGGDLTRY